MSQQIGDPLKPPGPKGSGPGPYSGPGPWGRDKIFGKIIVPILRMLNMDGPQERPPDIKK